MEDETKKPEETKEPTQVEKVKNDLEELKKANDEVEKELLRKEELRAKIALGGEAEGGNEKENTKKEETPQEYAEKIKNGEVGYTE